MLKLNIDNISENSTCATSGAALPACADVVRVVLSCGGQRNADAATTTVTIHEPRAFLTALSVSRLADAARQHELSAAASRAAPPRQGSRGGSSSSNSGALNDIPSRTCALTGAVLQPEDLVLLLPPAAAMAATASEELPSPGPLLVVKLSDSAPLLQPVLRAVGRDAAGAALAAVRGMQELDGLQRAEVRRKLAEVAEAAEAETGGGGSAETASQGSGGVADTAAAVTEAAAVDTTVRLDGDAQRVKRRRVSQPPADNGRPPLPRRSTRFTRAATAGGKSHGETAPAADDRRRAAVRGSDDGLCRPAANAPDAGAATAAPAAAAEASDSRVDLDRERRELMERNLRKLMELQLPGLAAGLAPAAGQAGGAAASRRQTSQRGVGGKRSRVTSHEPPPPLRMSLRQRGVAADSALSAGIEQETSAGVQLVAGRQGLDAAMGRAAGGAAAVKARHPAGSLPFRSDNGDEATDAAFLVQLKVSVAAASPSAADALSGVVAKGGAPKPELGGTALARLGLAEHDVAKVTKDGITHLTWLPGSERLLLAAGSTSGWVSMWDVDVAEDSPAATTDGVLMFSPHGAYVSGMRWLGRDAAVGPCRLITASYDGSLRALDLGGAGTWLELPAPGDPRVSEYSALDVSADGRTAYLGDPRGNFDIVDLRAPPSPRPLEAGVTKMVACSGPDAPHGGDVGTAAAAVGPVGGLQLLPRKINSLHLEPSGCNLLASSCSDGTVCIWDVRKLGTAVAAAAGRGGGGGAPRASKPLSVLHHAKSCHAAYWAHDGSRRLLSTSYDDTIRIWAPSGACTASASADGHRVFSQALSIPHNNQTGRWITPFRALWNADCDAVLVGNMRRGLDVYGVGSLSPPKAPPASSSEAAACGGDGAGLSHQSKTAAGSKGKAKRPAQAEAANKVASGGRGGDAGQTLQQRLLRTLVSEHMTAIPSRAACHPTLPVVAAATSSGRCHVWR